MSTAREMLHVGMGPSPLREPLDRPHPGPRPVRRVHEPAPRAVPRDRRLRAARRRTRFLLFAGIVVGGLVVLLVTAQALVAQSAFRADDLQGRITALQREQGRLRLRVAELDSPTRIAREALRQGLVLPEEIELIRVPQVAGEGVNTGSGAGKAPATDSPEQESPLGANP
jgi:cell division protein FtsL